MTMIVMQGLMVKPTPFWTLSPYDDDDDAGSSGELYIWRIHLAGVGLHQGERLLFLHRGPPSIGSSSFQK